MRVAAPPPAPSQAQSLRPCHAVPFLRPPRLRPTAASSNPKLLSLSNSQLYTNSFLASHKLTTSFSDKQFTCCGSGSGSSNHNDRPKDTAAAFFDEKGAIEDMDGYLNYLSLEYDSVWDTKPSWCQPWTIISTGVLIITASWLILRSLIVTSLVLTLICAWWYIFLFSYPKAYSEMIADRRNRVRSGVEDTYGSGRLQLQNKSGGDDAKSNSL